MRNCFARSVSSASLNYVAPPSSTGSCYELTVLSSSCMEIDPVSKVHRFFFFHFVFLLNRVASFIP